MSRLKAFAIHLGVSLAILLVPLYFTWFQWYPPPMFSTDGGWQGFRLLAVLFLLLGPGLTLLLFRPGKRGLWYDMVVIALLQIGVLGWGSWTLYKERPIAIVYTDGYFTPVTAYQLDEVGLTDSQLDAFDTARPVKIYVDLPEDQDEMQKFRVKTLQSGIPMYLFTELYQPLNKQNLLKIQRRGLDMEKLYAGKPQQYQIYQTFKLEHARKKDRLIFVPLHARHKRRIIALDATTGDAIATLDINPPVQ